MLPKKSENPSGLHRRYTVQKVEGNTDPKAEYFVLRLDEGGSDIEHIKACRIGVHAYADAIEHHLPGLAKDLRERYPLPITSSMAASPQKCYKTGKPCKYNCQGLCRDSY